MLIRDFSCECVPRSNAYFIVIIRFLVIVMVDVTLIPVLGPLLPCELVSPTANKVVGVALEMTARSG